jgi:peptidoglycan/LPS O-acetylase OafA/YrhL
MNAIIKPIAFGVVAYVVSAVGLWFVLSYALISVMPEIFWLLPTVFTLVPLFISGYVAARFTISNQRVRKVVFGVIAGLIGYGISIVVTQASGEAWFLILLVFGAAIVAAAGSFFGSRRENAL